MLDRLRSRLQQSVLGIDVEEYLRRDYVVIAIAAAVLLLVLRR